MDEYGRRIAAINKRKARAKEMAALHKTGWTLERIGDKYGVTRQRVHQLIKSLGRK